MSDDPVKLARTMAMAMDKTFHESNAANSWRAVANALEAAYAKIAELEMERDSWKSRAQQFQRERAELSDKINGTPCAEIRWQYERDSLRAKLERATWALSLAECVYRKNCAAVGEPSSVLNALQAVLSELPVRGLKLPPKQQFAFKQEDCPGHIASEYDSKVCGRCGIHIDELRDDFEGF